MSDDGRTDKNGRAYAGSQRQIQTYANGPSFSLNSQIRKALNEAGYFEGQSIIIQWTSPLRVDKYRERQDQAFLENVKQDIFSNQLRDFWPRGGPVWDALAIVDFPDNPGTRGVLLAEAKSYLEEMRGGGIKAEAQTSIDKINRALDATKEWIGVDLCADWTGPYYQYANRLAHLYFFRKVVEVPAWLVNVCFVNDPHRPTTREEWREGLDETREALGLGGIDVPYTAEVFPTASRRSVVYWKELWPWPPQCGHGVEFHAGSGKPSPLIAFLSGYDWRDGGDTEILIRPPDDEFDQRFLGNAERRIENALADCKLQHGELGGDIFAWFNG